MNFTNALGIGGIALDSLQKLPVYKVPLYDMFGDIIEELLVAIMPSMHVSSKFDNVLAMG